jgi:hypothetical protein
VTELEPIITTVKSFMIQASGHSLNNSVEGAQLYLKKNNDGWARH